MNRSGCHLIFLSFLFLASSCGWLTGPDDEVDPRKLTWTADTLQYEFHQTMMSNIWGSSEKDVYAVGHCSIPFGTMWHYDGKSWSPVTLAKTEGGTIEGNFNLKDITGFSKDNVWAVGKGSRMSPNPPIYLPGTSYAVILHFDGSSWSKADVPLGETLYSISGTGPDDIWAGGSHGTLFHYDGTAWTADSLPVPEIYDQDRWGYFHRLAAITPDRAIALYAMPSENWSHRFLYNGEEWIDDPDYFEISHYNANWLSPTNILYTGGFRGVWRITPEEREQIYDGLSVFFGLWGTSDENIFAVGNSLDFIYDEDVDVESVMYHYDGKDWYRYTDFIQVTYNITDLWTGGGEVFVVGRVNIPDSPIFQEASVIIHGR